MFAKPSYSGSHYAARWQLWGAVVNSGALPPRGRNVKQSPINQADGSLLHRLEGSLNGNDGFFEIAINPETNTISHRIFVVN